MNIVKVISTITLLLNLQFAIVLQAKNANTSNDHPNVIFFATDDLNTWVNPLGYTQAKTPNLSRLSEMGITFTNAHAPAVFCAPSRSAIWSGLHSSTTGCYNDEIYFYDTPELVSLQSAFTQAGYKAYGAGKLYHHRAGSIDMRGWEKYFSRSEEIRNIGYEMGYYGSDVPYPNPYPYSPYYTKTDRVIDGGAFMEWGPIAPEKAQQMPDAIRTNWVCDLLKQNHTDPFFIALGLYSPHFPNYAPQEFFDMYDRDQIVVPNLPADDLDDLPTKIRNQMTNRSKIQKELESLDAVKDAVLGYLAAVSFADAMLGHVLDALEASAYKDNTVVIFWSDQGYHHGEKGNWGKHTLWEETSHVPFIFAGNGLPKNQQVATTVSLIDLYPTLIEMCNLPEQHKMDGVSLVPALNNPSEAQERNVLMPYMKRGGYAVINSNYRYIQYEDGSEEFYDVVNDPNEWTNLASDNSYRSIINQMKQTAPADFHKEATARNTLKLIIEDDSYYWESKDGSKPATFINGSINFTNPITENGVSFVINTSTDHDAFTEQVTKNDQDCRYISASKFGYFKVDDHLFHSSDNEVYFAITYYDDDNSNFELQYNASGNANKSIVVAKTNTNKWLTKTLMVADAAFNNQLSNQADFRIKGTVYVRSVKVNKPMPSDVSVVFADQIIEKGAQFIINTDNTKEAYTEKVSIGEHFCRLIPIIDKKKYGYFRVDDSVIKPTDNELTFELTYFDLGTGTIRLQYNANSADYQNSEITKTDTKTWITKSFTVTDAALNNKQNNQSDFRIMGEAYIRRIAIRKETTNPSAVEDIKKSDFGVQVGLHHGMLQISIPEEMLHSELSIYNVMGQLVYRSKMNQTEERIELSTNSNSYIVHVRSGNKYIRKKIIVP